MKEFGWLDVEGHKKKTTTIKTPTIYQPCDAQSTLAKKKKIELSSQNSSFFFFPEDNRCIYET